MQRAELAGWLRLALTPGLGNTGARKLLAAFGLPQQVFAQPFTALSQVLPDALARAIAAVPTGLDELVDATSRWLEGARPGVPRELLTLADPRYPAPLLATEDPPLLLHATGTWIAHWPADSPADSPAEWPNSIAIVGSRNPTAQGAQNAREFARAFAGAGLTVVSGMALGIDGAAHEGALAGAADDALATVAVVGTGLDRVYPQQHHELAHRIASRGLLLSEYFIGTPPLAQNFPKRNRIISALSRGTLVVEAALQSGSLITARQAAEQGKDVFAIPGSIHSPQSRGCHALIKQGAKLVETAQDVLEEWPGFGKAAQRASPAADSPSPSPDDVLLERLGYDPVGIDALVARTGMSPASLQARLLALELEGEVARLPGGLYQRVGSA